MKELTGLVYGADFRFHPGTIRMEAGRIREVLFSDEAAPDDACYILPGLVDIHFHGCMGADSCDGTLEALRTIAAWEARQGVTSICPATLTLPPEELVGILSAAAAFAKEQETAQEQGQTEEENGEKAGEKDRPETGEETAETGADLVGLNMEGPFISRARKGAQNGDYILPCSESLCRIFLEASEGLVKIIGLAPEANPDFESYIRAVKEEVRVSLAHTDADYDTAARAFRAGASHVVHLFNAMPEMAHREPGVVGAAMDSPGVTAELICDGNHVHPAAARAAFALFGEERIVLVSDSLRAAGMGDGEILLGGRRVVVKGSRAVLAGDGRLAGSVSSLTDCLRTVVKEMGIPLESAVRCAAYNPAKVIGAEDRCGRILPGRKADLLVLDQALCTKQVYKGGRALPVHT